MLNHFNVDWNPYNQQDGDKTNRDMWWWYGRDVTNIVLEWDIFGDMMNNIMCGIFYWLVFGIVSCTSKHLQKWFLKIYSNTWPTTDSTSSLAQKDSASPRPPTSAPHAGPPSARTAAPAVASATADPRFCEGCGRSSRLNPPGTGHNPPGGVGATMGWTWFNQAVVGFF